MRDGRDDADVPYVRERRPGRFLVRLARLPSPRREIRDLPLRSPRLERALRQTLVVRMKRVRFARALAVPKKDVVHPLEDPRFRRPSAVAPDDLVLERVDAEDLVEQ